MDSIIATEVHALTWRHWLLDRLGARIDILDPARLTPVLARRIDRFLVAGLDYVGEPGAEGWPVPTGGRYPRLCFSPALRHRTAEQGRLHILPVTVDDYVGYVERITGLSTSEADDLFRIYRFTPDWLYDQCTTLRAQAPKVWCLLLSNEFKLARQLYPDLRRPIAGSAFRYPLIDGFMIIAEFERAHLMMRHLGRAQAIVDRPSMLDILQSTLPLHSWFSGAELLEIHRWLEYASFSSTTLGDLMFNRSAEDIAKLPKGLGVWAAATGETLGHAGTFVDDAAARAILMKTLTPPPLGHTERKRPLLRNHELWRWYGLSNRVLPIVALDGIRAIIPTQNVPLRHGANNAGKKSTTLRRTTSKVAAQSEFSRPVLVRLASAMRLSADRATGHLIVAESRKYVGSSKKRLTVELEANMKAGMKLALIYLPTRQRDGSAGRFDHTMWLTPQRDADFWRTLLDIRRGGRLSRYRSPTSRNFRPISPVLRRAYGALFAGAGWTEFSARVVCDLAAAIGPISGNPDIAYALYVLERKPRVQLRLGVTNRGGFGKGAKASQSMSKVSVR